MTETYNVATWEEHPYTSYDKRSWTVYHRVRIVVYETGFVDVCHERKTPEKGMEKWAAVDIYEVRPQGVTHLDVADGVMQE